MRITPEQLQETLKGNGKHTLLFLGMSGVGKTFWSTHLAWRYDLPRVEIDASISRSEELRGLLEGHAGRTPTERIASYFGPPWSDGFEQREELYLSIERSVMRRPFAPGTIIDLTGSAIYHARELDNLSRHGLVIHLGTDPRMREQMLHTFLLHPKPVCWNRYFARQDGESNQEALERCYAALLQYRETLYEKYADVSIPYKVHISLADTRAFVDAITARLAELPSQKT